MVLCGAECTQSGALCVALPGTQRRSSRFVHEMSVIGSQSTLSGAGSRSRESLYSVTVEERNECVQNSLARSLTSS